MWVSPFLQDANCQKRYIQQMLRPLEIHRKRGHLYIKNRKKYTKKCKDMTNLQPSGSFCASSKIFWSIPGLHVITHQIIFTCEQKKEFLIPSSRHLGHKRVEGRPQEGVTHMFVLAIVWQLGWWLKHNERRHEIGNNKRSNKKTLTKNAATID